MPYDLIYTDGTTQTDLVNEGLLLEIDLDAVPTAVEIGESFPAINDGYSPGIGLYYVGIVYNTERFEELGLDPPTSWDALWQPELAGRVAIPDISTIMGMPVTMAASKVATNGASFTDLEAGVMKLAELDLYSVYAASGDMQNETSPPRTFGSRPAPMDVPGSWPRRVCPSTSSCRSSRAPARAAGRR